jgi:hypothetical protein
MEKSEVWMSFASRPASFSPATTFAMASVFLSSASRAVGAWLVTPVEIETWSGFVFTVPVAEMETLRRSGASWLKAGAGSAAAARRAVARRRGALVCEVLAGVLGVGWRAGGRWDSGVLFATGLPFAPPGELCYAKKAGRKGRARSSIG